MADGTITLLDKARGARYQGLLCYQDDGDTGDPWVRRTPLDNPVILSSGQPVRVAVKEAGPLLTSFEITQELLIPQSATQDLKSRSSTLTPIHLVTTVTLRRGARRLDVTVKLNNTAKDHRLRVLFPTFLAATTSQAGSQFDVLTREITLEDTSTWVEPMPHTHPHRQFMDISDGTLGLGILTEGLMEYEVSDDASRTIAITLLRAFQQRNSVRGIEYPEQKDSQCLGEFEARFAIYPHAGDWDAGEVMQEALQHNTLLKSFEFGSSDHGTLPAAGSFLTLAPSALVLSAVKRGEDGQSVVVRCYNPTDHAVNATLTSVFPITAARTLNLLEEPQEELTVSDGVVQLEVAHKKIVTVALQLA